MNENFHIGHSGDSKKDSPLGCRCWLKTWISMGEKMLECISRRFCPVYLLQARMERVVQSVQYRVSPNNVRANGCGRDPLITACLEINKKVYYAINYLPGSRKGQHFTSFSNLPCPPSWNQDGTVKFAVCIFSPLKQLRGQIAFLLLNFQVEY